MDLRELQDTETRRHPWELVRLAFFAQSLKFLTEPVRVLDAGAGDGWFSGKLLHLLPSGSSITCFDSNYTSEHLSMLGQRSPEGLSYTDTLPNKVFDVILLLDVVEHIEDDREFLTKIVETSLSPDGSILFSVPAWPHLFSDHDRFLKHFRRYTPSQAKDLLSASGLKVITSGGIFHSLYLARTCLLWFENQNSPHTAEHSDIVWRHGYLLTAITTLILRIDTYTSQLLSFCGFSLPGLSWWARCQKST